MTFPNVPKPKEYQWATMVPDRRPQFKVHTTEGLANSAFSDKRPQRAVQKLHLVNGEWEVVLEYVPGEFCEKCGGPFRIKNPYGNNYSVYRYLDPTFVGRNMDAPVICHPCYRAALAAKEQKRRAANERKEYERLRKQFES